MRISLQSLEVDTSRKVQTSTLFLSHVYSVKSVKRNDSGGGGGDNDDAYVVASAGALLPCITTTCIRGVCIHLQAKPF